MKKNTTSINQLKAQLRRELTFNRHSRSINLREVNKGISPGPQPQLFTSQGTQSSAIPKSIQ